MAMQASTHKEKEASPIAEKEKNKQTKAKVTWYMII